MDAKKFICSIAVLAVCLTAQTDPTKQPLCRAALEGDLARVRALLQKGSNPNVRDETGRTPLMWAVSVMGRAALDAKSQINPDYAGVVRLLLDKGADINARDESGRTPLLLAMEGSASEYKVVGADEAMVRLLIARGANVNARDGEGWSPFLKAVSLWADQPRLISFLIASGADVKARLKDGRNGLMLAARLGKTDRLATLIGNQADVNASDEQGATALMVAALVTWEDAASEMMKLLLEKGADPNIRDRQGRTAADRTAEAGYLGRATFLLANGTRTADPAAFLKKARDQALRRAISQGGVDSVKPLLDQGADPNFRDTAGRTMLMLAAADEYSAERSILLLDHGASVNVRGPDGTTALMVAADQYQAQIVKALLERGADPNALDSLGNSVLMRAAASKRSWMEERQPLIHLLLEKKADVNWKNLRGVTALMLMAREGNPALALVVEKGADVNARDDQGDTALLYGARFFARGWQRRDGWTLLEKGADVNASNNVGETALILAATQSEPDAALLLLAKGANVNAKTQRGRTALMQAMDGPTEFDNEKHVVFSPKIAKALMDAGADVNAQDGEGITALKIALRRGYSEMAAALKQAGAKEY